MEVTIYGESYRAPSLLRATVLSFEEPRAGRGPIVAGSRQTAAASPTWVVEVPDGSRLVRHPIFGTVLAWHRDGRTVEEQADAVLGHAEAGASGFRVVGRTG